MLGSPEVLILVGEASQEFTEQAIVNGDWEDGESPGIENGCPSIYLRKYPRGQGRTCMPLQVCAAWLLGHLLSAHL